MITITSQALDAIKAFYAEKKSQKPIRIQLQSTGCCDASLGLMADDIRADDGTEQIQDILFVIGRELEKLTGGIAIAYSAEEHRTGFVLTSENPISEWSGFGVCSIKS